MSPTKTLPTTISGAVDSLLAQMPEQEKERIYAMSEDELLDTTYGFGTWVRDCLGLHNGNVALLRDTHAVNAEEASIVIIRALWGRLLEESAQKR